MKSVCRLQDTIYEIYILVHETELLDWSVVEKHFKQCVAYKIGLWAVRSLRQSGGYEIRSIYYL